MVVYWWPLSVPCLIQVENRSSELAGSKSMTRMAGDPIYRSKGQRSRSSSRLTPWPKISHEFKTGRPMNFKFGTGWSTITLITDVCGKLQAESFGWQVRPLQVTTWRGRGHIVTAPLQAAQLVSIEFMCAISLLLSTTGHYCNRFVIWLWLWLLTSINVLKHAYPVKTFLSSL